VLKNKYFQVFRLFFLYFSHIIQQLRLPKISTKRENFVLVKINKKKRTIGKSLCVILPWTLYEIFSFTIKFTKIW
jgi:hypothetical protein